MTKRHQGKTIVISGAASGIGQASAIRLAEEGAQIVIADRAKADDTLQKIKAIGGTAIAVQCDISDPASVAKLKEAVEKDGGRCDILVNNAGIYPMQRFDDITFEDWRRVLTVNLDSMFLMTKALSGGMRQRGWGRVHPQSIAFAASEGLGAARDWLLRARPRRCEQGQIARAGEDFDDGGR